MIQDIMEPAVMELAPVATLSLIPRSSASVAEVLRHISFVCVGLL